MRERNRTGFGGKRKDFRLVTQSSCGRFKDERLRAIRRSDADYQVLKPVAAIHLARSHRSYAAGESDCFRASEAAFAVAAKEMKRACVSGRRHEVYIRIGVKVSCGDKVGRLSQHKAKSFRVEWRHGRGIQVFIDRILVAAINDYLAALSG